MFSLLLLVLYLGFGCLVSVFKFFVIYFFLNMGKIGWLLMVVGFLCWFCWFNLFVRILFRSCDVLVLNYVVIFMFVGGLYGLYFIGMLGVCRIGVMVICNIDVSL